MGTLLELGLDNALVALILAPVVAVLGRACRRPALAHALWLLVLLKLLTPPLPRAVSLPISMPGASFTAGTPLFRWSFAGLRDGFASILEGPGRLIVAGFWIAGTVLWLVLTGWQIARFRRFLMAARPASSELQERACELASRLGLRRAPGVWLVPCTVAPMVWAAGGSPRLILPARLWDGLDSGQRDALLVHELAHLRRRDHWVRLLEAVVTVLYWWHPAVWWARRGLHEAEERCCDAWVVGTLPRAARSYATALLLTVDFLSETPTALPVGASGMGRGGHFRHLHRRLTLIMAGTRPRPLTGASLLAVLLLGLLTMPLSPLRESGGTAVTDGEREFRWYVVESDPRTPGAKYFLYEVGSYRRGDTRESRASRAPDDRGRTGPEGGFTFRQIPGPTPKPGA
jgi:beta-lactamase regulating signal transducer with metallopeptidase domain